MVKVQRNISISAVLMFCALISGCMHPIVAEDWGAPPKNETVLTSDLGPVTIPDEDAVSDIVRVNKIFGQFPWLSFNSDGSDRINGFKCSIYLEGSQSNSKGVFGNGTIVVTMFRLDTGPNGEVATPVFEWMLPPDVAYQFRAKEPTLLGWGYGLRLKWDDNVKVVGSKIAILIKYVRDDGSVVRSSRKVLRVPMTGDAWGHRITKRPRAISHRRLQRNPG
ncbi:MAG: hypothetical protein MI923_26465 [Phycisphaerales bacterium]|nr:hypothetical protein [Phycisphaerales bacterium]